MDVGMEPVVWGRLPKDILSLVFARLPVSRISQLRLLSRDWKKDIETRSLFNDLLRGKLGLITCTGSGKFCGRIFDLKSDRWDDFLIDLASGSHHIVADSVITVGAADGGLICFVSKATDFSLVFIVMNPLTRKWVELCRPWGMHNGYDPPLGEPTMVQLVMDSTKQQYKVFIAGYTPSAQVYDSKTKQWSYVGFGQADSWDRIHGCEHRWSIYFYGLRFRIKGDRRGPCVFDFVEGQRIGDFPEGRLQDFGGSSIAQGPLVMSYAVLKNRLFVLHKQAHAGPANLVPANDLDLPPNYYISEYHLQKNAPAWVKVDTHSCSPFDRCWSLNSFRFQLLIQACNRFLIVIVQMNKYENDPGRDPDDEEEIEGVEFIGGWLYDLSTREWRRLPWPKLPDLRDHVHRTPLEDILMCELRWDLP